MKIQDRQVVASLTNGFDLRGWIEAEREVFQAVSEPQPKNSVTVEQYAKMRGLSASRAQSILGVLYKSGKAKRKRWFDGIKGGRMVYWLKK